MPAKNKGRRFTEFIKKVIFATNVFAILLLLSSHLAWHVSPLKTNLFSYIGLAFGLILLLNVLYLIFWLIFSKWKLAAISLLSMVVCYNPILTFFPMHIFPQKPRGETIQVLTYNVQGFINERSKKAKDTPVLNYIADTDADIVCIQEYLISKTGQSLKTQQDVNRILNKYPYKSVTALKSSGEYHIYGLACFSKYPIEKTEEVVFNSSFNGAAIYTINIDGRKISVANVHLESNQISAEDKELYGKFLLNIDGANFENVTTNIRSRLGSAYRTRVTQVEKVKNRLAKTESDAVIICGDFNDTPISYAYAKMKAGLTDAFASSGFGPGISFNEDFFWFRIDNIFHSPNMKAYNAKVDRIKYSDHYPMRTYLSLNN